ncbi:hypothetical protein GGS24DRAFT_494797 [Hypoxylon argillaceum]|nr:hypothetical protein GGS24DRAFT_494797 [Hypoxylon argillaceum]
MRPIEHLLHKARHRAQSSYSTRGLSLLGHHQYGGHHRHESISRALHAALPSPEDYDILRRASSHVSSYYVQVMFVSYDELGQDELEGNRALLYTPDSKTHPVLLAKYMFDLATTLHYLDAETYGQHGQLDRLSQKPHVLAKRLADTARRLVTTDDELLGTVEGLQCVMMDGIYQSNSLVAGQLMGFHRPLYRPPKLIDPSTKFNAQFFWHRLVYTDRVHCLMLGLPQGSLDQSRSSLPAFPRDQPISQLERIHCTIASRILERNDADPASLPPTTLKQMNRQLREAASVMPMGWWLIPNMPAAIAAADQGGPSIFWVMLRLVTQLHHYNLLNQLFLPYILRFNATKPWSVDVDLQLACVHASRQVLSRYIAFRRFNHVPFCCRAIDFFGLVAALALLFAHLDNQRRPHTEDDALGQHRIGDRTLLQQALDNMDNLARIRNDMVSAKTEAAGGKTYSAQRESLVGEGAQGQRGFSNALVFEVPIAHFGMLRITRDGAISKMTPLNTAPTAIPAQQPPFNPGPTATFDEWALQGVHAVFFNILLGDSTRNPST